MEKIVADKNLFMMCLALNPAALTDMPDAFHVRRCRRDELERWKAMPFDSPKVANESRGFMTSYFEAVYASRENEFFERCLFVCDHNDTPIATCFGWKSYGKVSTIHWFKVVAEYEGLGIGRALLSIVMRTFTVDDYPVYLHTQPGSFRAIKLYSDFGFALLTDATIGYRRNEWVEALPFLQAHMFPRDYEKLKFARAPKEFLAVVQTSDLNQF